VALSIPPQEVGEIDGERCVYMHGPFDGSLGRFRSYKHPKKFPTKAGGRIAVYKAVFVDGEPIRDNMDNIILFFERYEKCPKKKLNGS